MTQPTPDQVLRLNILQLANVYPEDTVKRAYDYYSFVMGAERGSTGEAATDAKEMASEVKETLTAIKKTRKSKKEEPVEGIEAPVGDPSAEVEQAVFDLVDPEPKTEEAVPAKTVDYKEVQVAVLNLVRNKQPDGKERVIEILNQFGVATALDLKPEQYAKALDMFVCAFERA